MTEVEDKYRDWIGRQIRVRDTIDENRVSQLAAALDYALPCPQNGESLPLPWHWIFFQPQGASAALSLDGHEERGEFMPPVCLPRRMWAGSRVTTGEGITIGDSVCRQSTILAIRHKSGRSGRLVFVTVEHDYLINGKSSLLEEQDIVYRAAANSRSAAQSPGSSPVKQLAPEPDIVESTRFSTVLLFRYSALTFNSHRIHYDQAYVRDVEHYPDLVVHGPLLATRLLQFYQQRFPGQLITAFRHRSSGPLFADESCQMQCYLQEETVLLQALNSRGQQVTELKLTIRG